MDYMQDLSSAASLIAAYYKTKKTSGWKPNNQRYGLNLLDETFKLQDELRDGNYQMQDGIEFTLTERGHKRYITALTVRDMVAQHSLCDSVLLPKLTPHLIHDNGASLKGKGLSFTRRRFEQHLREHYRKHGTAGYILFLDFKKYFDNLDHERLAGEMAKYIEDPRVMRMIDATLQKHVIDISYKESDMEGEPLNMLEHKKVDPRLLTGEKFLHRSLGIGAPLSQIAGIFFPHLIDSYVKTVKGVRGYDVYMDDRAIIHESKDFLKELLAEIKTIAKELRLFIHEDKTQIVKISHGFTFLKTRYIMTDTGKLIKKIPRDVVTRERRKLKRLAQKVVAGELTLEEYKALYQSWRGDKRGYNAHQTLINMDKLYKERLAWITKNRTR